MGKQQLLKKVKVSRRVKKAKASKKKLLASKEQRLQRRRTLKIERRPKLTVTSKLFVVGNPMSGQSGSDRYSYRLNEVVDAKKCVIRANHYDFDVEGGDQRHVGPGSLYKLIDDDTFASCHLNDKGNWVLKKKSQNRSYIYLVATPIKTYLDPSF